MYPTNILYPLLFLSCPDGINHRIWSGNHQKHRNYNGQLSDFCLVDLHCCLASISSLYQHPDFLVPSAYHLDGPVTLNSCLQLQKLRRANRTYLSCSDKTRRQASDLGMANPMVFPRTLSKWRKDGKNTRNNLHERQELKGKHFPSAVKSLILSGTVLTTSFCCCSCCCCCCSIHLFYPSAWLFLFIISP